MITCKSCSRKYKYNRKQGHTKTRCNSCLVNDRRFKVKKQCVEYKGGACQECGYNKCSRALVFHHLNESEKCFEISGSHSRSWEIIQQELDKCIMICANCHAELHDGLIKV